MGTRHITTVFVDGEYRIAQYGQWDGYPEGQGITILEFLRDKMKPDFIFSCLSKVKIVDKQEVSEFLNSIGSKDGWMSMDQEQEYNKRFPYLSRDIGGDILELIQNSTDKIVKLKHNLDFIADGLFCEWAYVVDFDKGQLEVYKGFNIEPLTENDRFYFLMEDSEEMNKDRKSEYYPAKIATSFSLKNLPSNEEFLAHFKEEE